MTDTPLHQTTNYLTLEIKHVGTTDLLCAVSPDIPGLMVAGRSLKEVLHGVLSAIDELTNAYALHARGRL